MFFSICFFLMSSSSPWERHLTKIDSSKVSTCLFQIKFLSFFHLNFVWEFFSFSFFSTFGSDTHLNPLKNFCSFAPPSFFPSFWAFNNLLSLITFLSFRFHLFMSFMFCFYKKGSEENTQKRRLKWLDVWKATG
jgi:hypothetical protein